MAPPVETEIKLRMPGPLEAREAVERLSARPLHPRHFEDNLIFDDKSSRLARSGRALRLRRTAGEAVVTFKGPKREVEGVKSRTETEFTVADGDALQAVLEQLGFHPVFRYQKYREAYTWRDAEVVVDETPIGTFLEIEGPLATIHAAAAALGFGPADYVAESYAALFWEAGGTGDMVFK